MGVRSGIDFKFPLVPLVTRVCVRENVFELQKLLFTNYCHHIRAVNGIKWTRPKSVKKKFEEGGLELTNTKSQG